jgi:hypothetical protein
MYYWTDKTRVILNKQVIDYTFFYGNGNENHELGTAFPVHQGNISAVREGRVC